MPAHRAPEEDQQVAGESDLGHLQHVYRSEPALPLLGAGFTLVWLVILALMGYQMLAALHHPAPSVLPLPLWAMALLLFAGLLLLAFSGWWTIAVYRNRKGRILLYERGIVEQKRSGSRLIRTHDIKYISYSVPYTYNAAHIDHYSIEGRDGQVISFTSNLAEHNDLFENIVSQTLPALLAQARASYQAGQDVSFDTLVVNKAGIKITRTNQVLPWHEVTSVIVLPTGKVAIKRKDATFAWFQDFIANAEVFQRLAQEMLSE